MALDGSSFEREIAVKNNKIKLGMPELLAHARRKSGRKPLSIGLEVRRLNKSPGTITITEYVRYGLYDDERFSKKDKLNFIGEAIHWPVTSEVCDRTWDAATEDKWLAGSILQSAGVEVPETVAVIDRSARVYGAAPRLGNAEAVRDFLCEAELPLFCKVLRGVASFGAFRIEGADETRVFLSGHAPMTYEDFLDNNVGEHPYILQRLVRNHAFLDVLSTGTSTIRMCTFARDDGIFVPFVVLKLVSGDNVADNFWRPGNIICDIDPATGTIRSVVTQSGIDLVRHDRHPETGAEMIGKTLPMWTEVLEATKKAGLAFAPVRYQSLDIALTNNGPVVVEINSGGAWDLPQMASDKGFLTDEVRETFRSFGVSRF